VEYYAFLHHHVKYPSFTRDLSIYITLLEIAQLNVIERGSKEHD
jgi:hypothetical protein